MGAHGYDKVVLDPKDPIIDKVAEAIKPMLSYEHMGKSTAITVVALMLDQGWRPPSPEQAAHIATEDARIAKEISDANRGYV